MTEQDLQKKQQIVEKMPKKQKDKGKKIAKNIAKQYGEAIADLAKT